MNKAEVLERLSSDLLKKVEELEHSIRSTKDARDGDSKSSAGDKHEVGREMAQQELNTLEARLAKTVEMLHALKGIDSDKKTDQVAFGSLVHTDNGVYFIAIGYGPIEVGGEQVFCISMASPIGQLMSNQTAGNRIELNGRTIEILSVG